MAVVLGLAGVFARAAILPRAAPSPAAIRSTPAPSATTPSPSPIPSETGSHSRLVIHGTGDVNLDPNFIANFRTYGYEYAWSGLGRIFKRDDLTGAPLTGNKVRKLEFLLAEAEEKRADVVITCGGVQSNHARATAIAARQVGLDSVLLLRVDDPAHPPPVEGNVLLDELVGAEIQYLSRAEYGTRAPAEDRHTRALRQVCSGC